MNDTPLTPTQLHHRNAARINAIEGRTLLRLAKDGSLRPGNHYGGYSSPDAIKNLLAMELVERTLLGRTVSKSLTPGAGVQRSSFWGYVLTEAGQDMAIELGAGQ
jgi:hypothetical protein